MKISLKIFVFTYCIMILITVVGGFLLVDSIYRDDLDQAMDQAIDSNEVLYTYIATINELPDSNYAEYSLTGLLRRAPGSNDSNRPFVGCYGDWKEKIKLNGLNGLSEGQVVSGIIDTDAGRCIQVTSRCGGRYIINYFNISHIIEKRDRNYELYRRVIIGFSMVIAIVLYVFSRYVTKPLTKVTRMAEEVSAGNYSARINADYKKMKSYEVMRLGETLNQLAENTEEHISELEDMVQKREDFVGNFTHELKTPLTSIIGYADLIRTYDLKPDKRREYGTFIYNEGRRLEQLSFHLLQLIVMGRTEFSLVAINTEVLFHRLKEAVRFSAEKYKVRIRLNCEPAVVIAEPSLIVAAIINLIDNACKASDVGQSISVLGRIKGERYGIIVNDNGRGIPESEIEKIMEPFYMVDKSRARSQGGAGLGLALCRKIADIHGGDIRIKSTLGKGTSIMILIHMDHGGAEHE